MGIIPTVIKKPEAVQTSGNINADERKYLVNINSRIEDIKMQNLENAKFLRGISRKIENELSQMRELESGKTIETFDDSSILEGIERIENSVKELNASPIMSELDKLSQSVNGMNSDEVLYELDKIGKTISQLNLESVLESVQKINESIGNMDTNEILTELNSVNNTLKEFNADVILLEIDKVNKSLKELNPANLIDRMDGINENISRLDTKEVLTELNRVESMITEINSNAVLSELDRMRTLVEEKNSNEAVERLEIRMDRFTKQDYTEQLAEFKSLVEKNTGDIEDIEEKLTRVASMPAMVKSVILSENEKNLKEMDNHITDINNAQNKKIDGVKSLVGFTLWLSLLNVILMIVNILGII